MAARCDGPVRTFGSGPCANDNLAMAVAGATAFPDDARAIIEPLPHPRRARSPQWRVRFAPRWGPVAEPLMGWTGNGDPLASVELRFPDRASAERYCQRQGLPFTCRTARPAPRSGQHDLSHEPWPTPCCWPTGPHARCCDAYPIAGADGGLAMAG